MNRRDGTFTVADLQAIVAEEKAPPIADTFNAQAIARQIDGMIRSRAMEPPQQPAALTRCREALETLARDLPGLIEARKRYETGLPGAYASTVDGFAESEFFLGVQQNSALLDELLAAVHRVKPVIYHRARKRGERGSTVDHAAAKGIRHRLLWAWGEANGINDKRANDLDWLRQHLTAAWEKAGIIPVQEQQIGRIVVRCLDRAGAGGVKADAVRPRS